RPIQYRGVQRLWVGGGKSRPTHLRFFSKKKSKAIWTRSCAHGLAALGRVVIIAWGNVRFRGESGHWCWHKWGKYSAGEDKQRGAGRRLQAAALFAGIAQNSFQGVVEIASHLGHALIAILAKERRWLIIFKNSPALLVLKQNYPQRRVECSGELMAGHL